MIRSELSEKNPYWIERHRYHELKQFCLQYPIWKKTYESIDGLLGRPADLSTFGKVKHISNPTERIGIMKAYYSERMDMIWRAAEKAEPELAQYIVRGVTEGLSYDLIKVKMDIPCCKDVYYSAYRRFFWILNKERDCRNNQSLLDILIIESVSGCFALRIWTATSLASCIGFVFIFVVIV